MSPSTPRRNVTTTVEVRAIETIGNRDHPGSAVLHAHRGVVLAHGSDRADGDVGAAVTRPSSRRRVTDCHPRARRAAAVRLGCRRIRRCRPCSRPACIPQFYRPSPIALGHMGFLPVFGGGDDGRCGFATVALHGPVSGQSARVYSLCGVICSRNLPRAFLLSFGPELGEPFVGDLCDRHHRSGERIPAAPNHIRDRRGLRR